ncbi:hypothetical protein PN36_09555 [Candidatus Thiomargarita nelsonii]|uniref:Uncharacterized protein n=1 Tax=Candidatus Thiomargarita nelsonii TaxID=1003181 RepID=A0A0A6P8G4_9GAMM|nr:hypothetical protein PN36_09555 [Candidatus Thiomargarita nelsonii]
MFIKDIDFHVSFSEFSEKHYKKRFKKKYTKEWEITEKAIIESLKRVYRLKDTDRLDCIKFCDPYGLFKFYFSVAGTQKSPKKSGNRIILFFYRSHALRGNACLDAPASCKKREQSEVSRSHALRGNACLDAPASCKKLEYRVQEGGYFVTVTAVFIKSPDHERATTRVLPCHGMEISALLH